MNGPAVTDVKDDVADALRKFAVIKSAYAVNEKQVSRLDVFEIDGSTLLCLEDGAPRKFYADFLEDVLDERGAIEKIRRLFRLRTVFVRLADELLCQLDYFIPLDIRH